MQLLFNTIMLEPNRWTPDHRLTRPLVDLLSPVAAAGFAALEIWQYHLSGLDSAGTRELVQRLASTGLAAPAVGGYPLLHLSGPEARAEADALAALADRAADVGATALKVFAGRLGSAGVDDETRARSVGRLSALATRLAGNGMELTLETHGNTLCDTEESATRLLEELSPAANVGLCFQPYADQDTPAALAMYDRLRSAVRHVHLQNRSSARRACTRLADGDWIDYARFLPHLQRRGFDGLLCLEFTADIVPAEGAAFNPQRVLDHAAADLRFVQEHFPGA